MNLSARANPEGGRETGDPLREEPACTLLLRLLSEIEPMIASYELSEADVEELLRELIALLVHDWERLGSREIWLMATLRRSCLRRARRRQAALPPPA
ncbi:MAG TPA: hypothetical protein VHU81_07930 [Thermoanaerobaculia bacterium]|jgi:hypothetical protein|nr:hypothetical protein [Thermoanaerobaculia bacterium]